MDAAIEIRDISKRYLLGGLDRRYVTFREQLLEAVRSPFRSRTAVRAREQHVWALRDVTLSVDRGSVFGLIGPNGSGKTTLLKILSRITTPTAGSAILRGRVGSLLEVGTGFHPELSGRDNIFLSGAVLGLRRNEVQAKFDEIVSFAEVERFLDTPVKHYSSGMYVRLGFAVAAHLEPEILLVDEVLAVGDAAFQKKCLGKMGDVAKQGRTILFVSHNMGAVRQLCTEAVLLRHGRVAGTGKTDDIIEQYLRGVSAEDRESSGGSSKYLQALWLIDSSDHRTDSILAGGGGTLRVHYDTGTAVLESVRIYIAIYDLSGTKAVHLSTVLSHHTPQIGRLCGAGKVDCVMAAIPLTPGAYRVNVAIEGEMEGRYFDDRIVNACPLVVLPSDYHGPSRMKAKEEGFVLVKHHWLIG